MRILIIEDDHIMAKNIELLMRQEKWNAYWTDTGDEGIDLAKIGAYDCIVLDVKLPDTSGLNVLRSLRQSKVDTPVVVVSGNALIETRVKALCVGADDYITKPFHKDELVARIRAVVRRANGHSDSVIVVGDLTVNLDRQTVEVAGKPVCVTPAEYKIIELLSMRRGSTLGKQAIMDHLYGGMDEPDEKIIDVFVCKLRKKLAEASKGDTFVSTVWGRGYTIHKAQALAA